MDIQSLKQYSADLSTLIQNAIERFEKETGTCVACVDLNRINVGTIGSPDSSILNVDMRIEL